jgi:hypothetical protein
VKSKPPRGFVAWDEAVFDKLVAVAARAARLPPSGQPRDVAQRARPTRRRLRGADGRCSPRTTSRVRTAALVRRSIAIYRSLIAAGALERLDQCPTSSAARSASPDLQADFALDNPLSPFVLEAVPRLDASSPTWPLDVMSVVEATSTIRHPCSSPSSIAEDRDARRTEGAGVEYEERIEALDKLEYPKPLREWTYDLFDAYRVDHPWAADYNIRPKSIARDLYERAMTSRSTSPTTGSPAPRASCSATSPTSTGASSATFRRI